MINYGTYSFYDGMLFPRKTNKFKNINTFTNKHYSLFFFQLDKIHCNSALDSDPLDIDKYLPIKSDEEAIQFCRDDGMLEQRKKALLRRLYGASDTSNLANFVGTVCDILFHVNYQITHRWPSKQ